jgi:SAM-dependent methyltransferase
VGIGESTLEGLAVKANVDVRTVEGFGDEWTRLPQDQLTGADLETAFDEYFGIFPWERLPAEAEGADYGCGSGRWAQLVAPRVGSLLALDASADALATARTNLAEHDNVDFFCGSVEQAPVADGSLDFAYSLGVLHHVPDTEGAIQSIARKLKPGAPFLIYLYYAFDNRPLWYRALWRLSDLPRRAISRMPYSARSAASDAIAAGLYWPLARSARLLERAGRLPGAWPLAAYRNRPFYMMRTDALDRFGTRLEKRFTRAEIEGMLSRAGFGEVRFSDQIPFWLACAVRR